MPGTCAVHPDRPIHGVCTTCGRLACDQCLVELGDQSYCKSCLETRVRAPARRVYTLLRLVLSVIPGVGHLYLGLLNRGFQIAAFAVLGGFVLDMLSGALAYFWVAGVVFYSIFDAREAHLRFEQGVEVVDTALVDWRAHLDQRRIGYGLVAIGVLALFNTLLRDVLAMHVQNWYYERLVAAARGSALGVVAIAAGLTLLLRGRGSHHEGPRP